MDLPKHMTSRDALRILKTKEAAKRRLLEMKEMKSLEKLAKTEKQLPQKNEKNQ